MTSESFTPDKTIASRSNALVGEWLETLSSKGVKKHGLFIVAGSAAVRETLSRNSSLARSLFVCTERHLHRAETAELVRLAREKAKANEPRFSVIALAKAIFDELDVSGTHEPLLLTRAPEIPETNLALAPSGLEILCSLGDPANVGALLRSAAAFGASKVIFLKESASPFHPKAVRAASASTLLTPFGRGPSIHDLKTAVGVVALDMNGKDLGSYTWPKDVRLLIGEEGPGVPSSTTFEYVSIPMAKKVESLNATVAASIALYSYSQRKK